MTLLQKSPERLGRHRADSPADPLDSFSGVFHTVYKEISRLKGSIEPFTKSEIDIKPEGMGYFVITPTKKGKNRMDEVGFDVFSKAVQLALVSREWGIIVKEVDSTHQTIKIFVSDRASQRE